MTDNYWLGMNPIRCHESCRIVAPKITVKLGILEINDDVFWGYHTEHGWALASRLKYPFTEEDTGEARHYRRVASTSMQRNRTVTIPRNYFQDEFEWEDALMSPLADEAESLSFSDGETLHFITATNIFNDNMSYVVRDEHSREFILDRMAEVITDGGTRRLETDGGYTRLEADTIDEVVPEAIVGESEALHIESGEVLPLEEVKARLEEVSEE